MCLEGQQITKLCKYIYILNVLKNQKLSSFLGIHESSSLG